MHATAVRVVAETCPKCNQSNRDGLQFCVRCHTPLRYTCPACAHVQPHGGTCDACGIDFLKYGMTRLAAMQSELELARTRTRSRAALVKSIVLAPFTVGFSLFSYFRSERPGH